jgi:hypothetical protein
LIETKKNTPMDLTTTPNAEGEQPAADTPLGVEGEHATTNSAVEKDSQDHQRRIMPRLDLDESIAAAREAIKQAKKDMMEACRVSKNENGKKRFLRKAAQLSSEDLERIAILKRCGLETKDAQSAKTRGHGAAHGMSSDAMRQQIGNNAPVLVDKAAMEPTVTTEAKESLECDEARAED